MSEAIERKIDTSHMQVGDEIAEIRLARADRGRTALEELHRGVGQVRGRESAGCARTAGAPGEPARVRQDLRF